MAASSGGMVPKRFERMEGVERVSMRRLITASRVRCVGGHMLNLVANCMGGLMGSLCLISESGNCRWD